MFSIFKSKEIEQELRKSLDLAEVERTKLERSLYEARAGLEATQKAMANQQNFESDQAKVIEKLREDLTEADIKHMNEQQSLRTAIEEVTKNNQAALVQALQEKKELEHKIEEAGLKDHQIALLEEAQERLRDQLAGVGQEKDLLLTEVEGLKARVAKEIEVQAGLIEEKAKTTLSLIDAEGARQSAAKEIEGLTEKLKAREIELMATVREREADIVELRAKVADTGVKEKAEAWRLQREQTKINLRRSLKSSTYIIDGEGFNLTLQAEDQDLLKKLLGLVSHLPRKAGANSKEVKLNLPLIGED